ncbi:MAG: (d)CMP kinase [Clostridiales bacterium]|nr:(d)CMP kinase [Clostridiales bacterium]
MIITLDGQSGTGKSTLANKVAKKLGFKCLNTGMVYRAISYYLYQQSIFPDNEIAIVNSLSKIHIQILFEEEKQFVIINNVNCTPYVSSIAVQQNVSLYSQILPLRERVTSIQREFALCNNVVVEGRDIGTHVFPDADYKFFITCDIHIRAQRRMADLISNGQQITLKEVVESLKNRDILDTTRKFSPLKRADDAIDIDTSHNTIEQSVNEIIKYIKLV